MDKCKGRPIGNDGRSEVEVNTYDFLNRIGISYETVCHPYVNTATIRLLIQDLLEKFVPASGHEYREVTLKAEE